MDYSLPFHDGALGNKGGVLQQPRLFDEVVHASMVRIRPVATAGRTRSVRGKLTLDQLRRRSFTSVQGPAEEREHLGPAALGGGMIVHGEFRLHPAMRRG